MRLRLYTPRHRLLATSAVEMDPLTSCVVSGGGGSFLLFPFPPRRRSVGGRPGLLPVLRASANDKLKLDEWELMELQFGRLSGEDPNLTLAKIMARRLDPDVSYIEVEKSFRKNKGKLDDYTMNSLADVNVEELLKLAEDQTRLKNQKNSRNVTRVGNIKLSRPTMNRGTRPMRPSEESTLIQTQQNQILGDTVYKSRAPNISLRKPAVAQNDDIEMDSKSNFNPNVFSTTRKNSSENLINLPLLKKPEVVNKTTDPEQESVSSENSFHSSLPAASAPDTNMTILNGGMLLNNTDLNRTVTNSDENQQTGLDASSSASTSELVDNTVAGLQPPNQSAAEASSAHVDHESANSISVQIALLEKPQRVDSSIKGISRTFSGEKIALQHDVNFATAVTGTATSADQEEIEKTDWEKAEHLMHSGEKSQLELISCSSRGFVVSFGSLIGFLPYQHLGTKWKFLAFESWSRKKGVDPSLYRQHLSILGRYDVSSKYLGLESTISQEANENSEVLPPKVKFENLLEAYDQEKANFLSSFNGQKLWVSVILADRKSRKLLFSGRPKEKEELLEKKRNLMARLRIGDIVKCCITKITYFGIFVAVEGVPALIHQSEISWDAALDPEPSSFYKVGQIVEAKVHQLDYTLERFTLSLRDITALESVVGNRASLGGRLETTQADIEWADVEESLIKELQNIDGITSVSRGRFFISPGLVPTFQVYMASMFDNKYKLLARYENKVQELFVESCLDNDQMRAAILTCTNSHLMSSYDC